MMTIVGVLAILFGGSSASSGGSDILGGIASLIAGIIVIGGLYLYWAFGVIFFFWLFEDVLGWRDIAPIGLILPIVVPMLIASVINGIAAYRAHSKAS